MLMGRRRRVLPLHQPAQHALGGDVLAQLRGGDSGSVRGSPSVGGLRRPSGSLVIAGLLKVVTSC